MVYKFVTRFSVEEHIMQTAKKKMTLEHAIVENIEEAMDNDELDQVLKFGAKVIHVRFHAFFPHDLCVNMLNAYHTYTTMQY